MSNLLKREIPLALTFICAISMILVYFFAVPPSVKAAVDDIQTISVSIANFSFGLGAAYLLLHHGRQTMNRTREKWIYSLIVVICLPLFIAIGLTFGIKSSIYQFIYANIATPGKSAIYGLPAFYMCSAAYRAVRARSKAATILLIMAVLVMLGNIGIGEALWPGFVTLKSWILNIPSAAGNRAIKICLGIGGIYYGLRLITGKESAYLPEEM